MRKGGMTFGEFEVDDKRQTAETGYDAATFWDSFFKSGDGAALHDRDTIGPMVTVAASRFHFNAVENGIIRAVARQDEFPYGWQVKTWEFAKRRAELRLVDIGSGTGHWIDFFRDALYVNSAIGIEVAAAAVHYLRSKYSGQTEVQIVEADIGSIDFEPAKLEREADFISAIGVMFHIVDDERWLRALENMKAMLAPHGLMFIGGDFGATTRNLQYHRADSFDSLSATAVSEDDGAVRVNKRVRSLANWHAAAAATSLAIVDLVRVDCDWTIHTPENDVLVLGHARPASDT